MFGYHFLPHMPRHCFSNASNIKAFKTQQKAPILLLHVPHSPYLHATMFMEGLTGDTLSRIIMTSFHKALTTLQKACLFWYISAGSGVLKKWLMVSGQQRRGKEAWGGGAKQVWSVGREEDKMAWEVSMCPCDSEWGRTQWPGNSLGWLGEKDSEIDEEG